MGYLEVRRHADRKISGGSQLSQAGVDRARAIGSTIGPFATVVASVVPRARETAIAMGFAVDYELITLTNDPDVYDETGAEPRWWTDAQPFVALAKKLEVPGAFRDHAHALAALWRDVMTPLGPDDNALIISHSGEIEMPLAALFPNADHASWGRQFGTCEGARLHWFGEPASFRSVEFLRG
jgi:broad specificity phosphatase PhoE